MTALALRLLVLLTLASLAACGPEVKQSTDAGSRADQPQQVTPAPSTAPSPAPAPTPAAPPPGASPTRPASQPAREEAPPKAPAGAPQRLIISVGQANLREKPDARSRILQVLSKGTKLVVISKGNQWYRVRLDSGREGWVAESVVTAAPN